ncbi:MAG: hypothetical protein MZU79_06950 [Anaerotruncus sp.]|nr:hypothetical protein [Anaerotruncus sp.]
MSVLTLFQLYAGIPVGGPGRPVHGYVGRQPDVVELELRRRLDQYGPNPSHAYTTAGSRRSL